MSRIAPAMFVALLAAAPGSTRLTTGQDKGKFIPTDQYESREVAGWTVRVNKSLLGAEADLGRRALRHLEFLLEDLERRVPAKARAELRKVPFWLGVNDWRAPEACYHPSAAWLRDHGFNPDKAKAVEIGNASEFLKATRDQPMMVLHELSHAYHDQVLSFDHAGILDLFAKAKASGKYDSVLRVNGSRERAYAITNHHEYFAEASEAFFGANDFYPFVRAELKEHDPDLYRLLKELWEK